MVLWHMLVFTASTMINDFYRSRASVLYLGFGFGFHSLAYLRTAPFDEQRQFLGLDVAGLAVQLRVQHGHQLAFDRVEGAHLVAAAKARGSNDNEMRIGRNTAKGCGRGFGDQAPGSVCRSAGCAATPPPGPS